MLVLLLTSIVSFLTLLFFAFLLNQQAKFVRLIIDGLVTLIDAVTLPVYCVLDKPWKVKRLSRTYWADRHYEPRGGYTYWECRSDVGNQNKTSKHSRIQRELENVGHLSELLPLVEKVYGNVNIIGKRKLIRKTIENGQPKYELGDYEWQTYTQVIRRIRSLAKALHHNFQLKRGDRVGIMADTGPEWITSFFALQCLGCELVTLHTSLDDEQISYILNLNRVECLFTQADLIRNLNKLKPTIETTTKLINLKNDFAQPLTEDEVKEAAFQIFDADELIKEGQTLPELNFNNNLEFSTKDIAVVMFTSGSTGQPKGVLLSHACMIQNGKRYMDKIMVNYDMDNSDTFLGYLPSSHILEMLADIICFMSSVKIAYGKPQTLVTGAPLLAKGTIGDVQASQLTFWVGVPLVFERVRSSIQNAIRDKSPLAAQVYDFAYEYKKRWSRRGFQCRLTDAVFFQPIRAKFSNRLKLVLTGGAPLTAESSVFIKMFLDVDLMLAYAATECAASCLSGYSKFDDGNTLALQDGIKLRLEDWEEGGYTLKDKPNPRGEILIGSSAMSDGYFALEQETKATFIEENGIRWWRSGDIAEINEFGHVSIVDRKKDLVKLQCGKFIALGRCEAVLKNCIYVENIVLHGNSYYNHLIALLQPNRANVCKLAESLGKNTDDLEQLYEDPDIKQAVLDELKRFGKANGLTSMEVPYLVKLCPDVWTPQNKLLTATLKTSRAQVCNHYRPAMNEMYKELKLKFPTK